MRELVIASLSGGAIGVSILASMTPAAAFWPFLIAVIIVAGSSATPSCSDSRRFVDGARRRVEIRD